MVIVKRIVPLALLAAAIVSCACFDLSTNKLKLRTDCLGGEPADSELDFVIAPDVGAVSDALDNLPVQVPIHCNTTTADDGALCASVGIGTDPSGNTAVLCDAKMQVAGLVDAQSNTFFLCTADHAFGEGGIYPMACTYIDIQQNPKQGPAGASSCKGIAVIQQTDSAAAAAAAGS